MYERQQGTGLGGEVIKTNLLKNIITHYIINVKRKMIGGFMSAVNNHITKGMLYVRGDDTFKCTVTYSAHKDLCVFHDIDVPVGTSRYVLERFLDDAFAAMYKKIEEDMDKLTNASGWVYGGNSHD